MAKDAESGGMVAKVEGKAWWQRNANSVFPEQSSLSVQLVMRSRLMHAPAGFRVRPFPWPFPCPSDGNRIHLVKAATKRAPSIMPKPQPAAADLQPTGHWFSQPAMLGRVSFQRPWKSAATRMPQDTDKMPQRRRGILPESPRS